MHMKRQKVPKSWPTSRKGNKFVVGTKFNPEKGIPLLIVLRDLLKIAQNRREVKKALHMKNILLNGRIAKDEKHPALLYDVVAIVPAKKFYKIGLSESGKFEAQEIKESEAGKKVSKVVNKKLLKGKKIQLNLFEGRNVLSDIKCNVNDSVVLDFKTGKIDKCLALKEKAKIEIFGGKHAGEKGVIEKIKPERKMAKANLNGKDIEILIKQIIVVE